LFIQHRIENIDDLEFLDSNSPHIIAVFCTRDLEWNLILKIRTPRIMENQPRGAGPVLSGNSSNQHAYSDCFDSISNVRF
jgi:hypothetical protein